MIRAPIFYTPKIVGFAPYAPQADNRLIIERVKDVLTTYSSYLPLTLRQVYYRLISTHEEYPKTEAFYEKLGTVVTRARRAGLIDWDVIRDDGIQTVLCGEGYDGPKHFYRSVMSSAEQYTRDKQADQSRQIILICEAAGMVPQLEQAGLCTLRTCDGQRSCRTVRAVD